jgi:hypothetical protein
MKAVPQGLTKALINPAIDGTAEQAAEEFGFRAGKHAPGAKVFA